MGREPSQPLMGDTGAVPDWSALITSVLVVGLLALLLRWAYGGRGRSLVERRPSAGGADDYGLMVAVSSPGTFIQGELDRQRLQAARDPGPAGDHDRRAAAHGARGGPGRGPHPARRTLRAGYGPKSASGSRSRVTSAPRARSAVSKPG